MTSFLQTLVIPAHIFTINTFADVAMLEEGTTVHKLLEQL